MPRAEHRRVAEVLRRRLQQGSRWRPGAVLPSLRALATELDVGLQTVRQAVGMLRAEGWLNLNPRKRLVARVPEEAATALAGGVILLVLGKTLDRWWETSAYAALQEGLERGATEFGVPLLIAHGHVFKKHAPEDLQDLPLRGVVVAGPYRTSSFAAYQRLNVPVVLVDRPDKAWRMHAAVVDNAAAARDATARLLALGHRRIAFLRYLSLELATVDPDAQEREAGYREAYALAGIARPSGGVFNISDYDAAASSPYQGLLNTKPPFTAALCTDPERARMLMEAAAARGMQIPKDLSVVCFQSARAELPHVAGPRVDFVELGRAAMHLLRQPPRPAQIVRLAASWHEGRTVAAPSRRV